jgi:hypothetical protein
MLSEAAVKAIGRLVFAYQDGKVSMAAIDNAVLTELKDELDRQHV